MDALRNTCAVYTLDLPGFGQSDSPPTAWGAHDYAALVERFLNAVGLLRVSVVGHSFGGRIGIVLAAEYSDRVDKLVLIDSAGVRPRRGARYYLRVGTVKTAKLLRRVGGAWGTALHARIVRFVASSDYLAVNDVLRPTFVRVVNEDLRQLLPRLAPPTLLLWGSNDRETPLAHAKTMERLIPDAGLVVWEGAGHYSYLDEPVRSGRVLRQFLTGAP
jgi:pimeloyl-ACP methyl ester carboxylesterase